MSLNQEKASELLDRLLKSQTGREVLAKKLNLEFATQATANDNPDMPIVAVCVPIYKHPQPRMQDALTNMMRFTKGKAMVYTAPPLLGSSVVHWSRNMLLAGLIKAKTPWTHVLFIDDDMVPEPDALLRLLAHKVDIVAAGCTTRADPPAPNFKYFHHDDATFSHIYNWKDGVLLGGLEYAVGTGMMLITRHALEEIAAAYFNCLYEKEMFAIDETLASDPPTPFEKKVLDRQAEITDMRLRLFDEFFNAYWFRFLSGLKGCNEYGEDMSFCLMATRYCKIPIHIDTSIKPGHIGDYGFTLDDFIMQRDTAIAKAKADGTYRVPVKLIKGEKISILCPTRNRPENVKRLIESLKATSHEMPEVILYVDSDDTQTSVEGCKSVIGPRQTLSACWNECAKKATGDILMFAADDLIFKTKGWDSQVREAFNDSKDKIIFVYGNDGHFGSQFGTHGFVHRRAYDALGYVLPPYFSADYGDTWINDIYESIGRRVYIPVDIEHMHPLWGKAEWDQTHKERLARAEKDGVAKRYEELLPQRIADVEKLQQAIMQPQELAQVG